jgi:ankyrin repeat protein
MKHLLITTIAAVLLVGCATTQSPKLPTVKAPDISIHYAADRGNIEAVKQHIAAGTDVNAKSDGRTPLHWAAYSGHKEIAELLIGEGAEVNTIDKYTGNTALDSAILLKHTEIADLLRKHGGKTGEELKAEGK